MAYTTSYFLLRWNFLNNAWTVRAFRMLMADARPHAVDQGSTFFRDIDRNLIELAATTKRLVEGIVRVSASEGTTNPQYGTLADLKAAWAATDLGVKMWDDSDYWNGRFMGNWLPEALDPVGDHFMVPIHIEQK